MVRTADFDRLGDFLGTTFRDFGIVDVLALAGPPSNRGLALL